MGLLQKIYKSFDMLGNRIKNVKVDLPSRIRKFENSSEYNNQKDLAANKEYVDIQTTYDTNLYKNQNIKPTLEWYQRGIESNDGDSVKTVLDSIFFSKKNPEWTNPEIKSIDVKIHNLPLINTSSISVMADKDNIKTAEHENTGFNKYPVFNYNSAKIVVNLVVKLNDFSSSLTPKIEYRGADGVSVWNNFPANFTKSHDGILYAQFNINLSSISNNNKFWLIYDMTSGITKKNNHNENITPSQQQINNATLTQDITKHIHSKIIWFDTFFHRIVYNPTSERDGYSQNINNYVISNNIKIQRNENVRIVFLTTIDWKKYNLGYYVYDSNSNLLSSGTIKGKDCSIYTDKSIRVHIMNSSYNIYSYDFGYFNQQNLIIQFFPLTI